MAGSLENDVRHSKARQGTSKQLCGFRWNSSSAIMHVCHQQKRTIYIMPLPIHISIDQTPAAMSILPFLLALLARTHSQLHKANEQFEMALWTLEMNSEKNTKKFIYGACLFVYQLQITIYQQRERTTIEPQQRVIFIEHKFRIGKSICIWIWIFLTPSYSTWWIVWLRQYVCVFSTFPRRLANAWRQTTHTQILTANIIFSTHAQTVRKKTNELRTSLYSFVTQQEKNVPLKI